MAHRELKWSIADFSQAMANAIFKNASSRFLRQRGDILTFNGFWRNGDKQNVCAWLDKATWNDAKTGDGGGCKEFAKIAFDMTLPDFMKKYGQEKSIIIKQHNFNLIESTNTLAVYDIDAIWTQLCKHDQNRYDFASDWLENERGIADPRAHIGSGFANLYEEDLKLFSQNHQWLIKQRLFLGANIAVPLRDSCSNKIKNFIFRAMAPVQKDQKSRLLTGTGGFGDTNNPRAFGFPHLIPDFPNLVFCEGMADYFAAEFLLDDNEDHLPIGAPSADGLVKWAFWLIKNAYKGTVNIVFHLDTNSNGEISTKEIGPKKTIQAARLLNKNKINVQIFPWHIYLKETVSTPHKVKDLADSLKQEMLTKEHGWSHLKDIFLTSLKARGNL